MNTHKKIDIKITNGTIPCIVWGDLDQASSIYVHLNAANGVKEISKFFDLPDLHQTCYCVLDLPGHGECKIKPSKFYSFYVEIVKKTIASIKDKYKNITTVTLIGESFGGNIAVLFNKKYPNFVYKIVAINPPLAIRNPKSDKTNKNIDSFVSLVFKYIATYVFNIRTYSVPHGINKLTSNQTFLRMWEMTNKTKKQENKVNVACWRSMGATKRYILKHFKNQLSSDLILVDTKTEFYYPKNVKTLDKIKPLSTQRNKIYLFDSGDHLLTIDKNIQKQLWQLIL